ncbi:MAG: hypothetical protein ABFE07_29360 [Armatimonadia bacterium]
MFRRWLAKITWGLWVVEYECGKKTYPMDFERANGCFLVFDDAVRISKVEGRFKASWGKPKKGAG